MKAKDQVKRWVSLFFFSFPRFFVSYAFYGMASIIIIRPTRKEVVKLFLFLFYVCTSWVVSSLVVNVSITALILSIILQFPFFCFLFKFKINANIDAFSMMRYLNVMMFIFSIVNMTVFWGFPFKLPYLNYLPDAFGAFYWKGGSRIVTLVGFFGVSGELFTKNKKWKLFYFFITACNFIVPNYLTALLLGIGALAIVALRKKLYLVPLIAIMALIAAPYALERMSILNDDFTMIIGYNPKVFAYLSVVECYSRFPLTILFGTGTGQFTGTPSLWSSIYLSSLSTHEIPSLPGLFMTDYHREILGPVFSRLTQDASALTSSANKPYNSTSTCLAEYGLPFCLVILYLYFNAFSAMDFKKKYTLSIFCFTSFLFGVDLWHDSLWYGYLLLLSSEISKGAT